MSDHETDDAAVRAVMRTLAEHGEEFYWYTRPDDAPDNLISKTGAISGRCLDDDGAGWSMELTTLREEWASRIFEYIKRQVRDEYGDEIPDGFVRIEP